MSDSHHIQKTGFGQITEEAGSALGAMVYAEFNPAYEQHTEQNNTLDGGSLYALEWTDLTNMLVS